MTQQMSKMRWPRHCKMMRNERNRLVIHNKIILRGVFFNTCHLLDYFSRGLTMRMLFICDESVIFSGPISIKIIAL